jgi:hypothetical protein
MYYLRKFLCTGFLEGTTTYAAQTNKTAIQNAITNENSGNGSALVTKCP